MSRDRFGPDTFSGPVVPVVVLDEVRHAVPLARALVAGGLRDIEITLRTPAALDAIRRIAGEVPEARVGAGTVLGADDAARALEAGARFLVSPGLGRGIAAVARERGVPLVPGVATPTEVMAALDEGFSLLKFFPAAAAGGLPMLRAMAGPFPSVRFCPTGGIDARGAPDWLALPNVAAVGGTWPAPAPVVAREDWSAIEALARAAAALRAPSPPSNPPDPQQGERR
ncbi:MAG TPA: bifunctional 4-hydroxy-2-oxoglutarate aldolase/2-dehydro-3-deoxy-phosphogluconate aldolase [Burkholderiaceae bacterium]|nr:bifunctional 4-hydroxy-2-oxoglutarate aldolase/2-dehydro-3-deoxy-phosphogluconate aldolase [Burkholderiaceae bacterium]